MSWLGAGATDRHPVYNPHGLDKGASRAKVLCRALSQGSLLLEVAIPDQFNQPLDLIEYERHDRFRRSLHMVLGPNGRLWVAVEAGQELSVLSLDLSAWPKDALIRISYSWDLSQQSAWLGAEHLETGELKTSRGGCAALHEEDLARVLYGVDCTALAPEVHCFAFADHIEPLGYSEGIGAGALVETATGAQPIETLRPGAEIVTSSGSKTRLLAGIVSHVPAIGSLAPLRVRRPFQNLKQTLDLTPRCEILTEGVDAAYLFGVEHVAVKPMHLAPFLPVAHRRAGLMSKRYMLVLEEPQPFRIAGISVLATGQHHDSTSHGLTRLAHLPYDSLPQKDATATMTLLRHEAVALMSPRYL
ncbi:Hint domain-containing protein [uncultured Celeribacter sp.]|uniref:Hint domain-containing protein n=1 Tax=uncultured Celeribacter sp. TaxID=1303376 RepID=UPI002AA7683F|nr:Hint domain-containing protein [uncultured Celeribacter sp.]